MRLQILDPCREDWTQMHSAGDRRRFCGGCEQHVLDLAGLTEVAANSLVEAELTKGRVCIRLEIDAVGTARFPAQTAINPHWHRMAFVAGLVLATPSGCADPQPESVRDDGCTYVAGPRTFILARGEGSCPAAETPEPNVLERPRTISDNQCEQILAQQEALETKLGGYTDDSIREKLLAERETLAKESAEVARKLASKRRGPRSK